MVPCALRRFARYATQARLHYQHRAPPLLAAPARRRGGLRANQGGDLLLQALRPHRNVPVSSVALHLAGDQPFAGSTASYVRRRARLSYRPALAATSQWARRGHRARLRLESLWSAASMPSGFRTAQTSFTDRRIDAQAVIECRSRHRGFVLATASIVAADIAAVCRGACVRSGFASQQSGSSRSPCFLRAAPRS